jgi:hypothetical protein
VAQRGSPSWIGKRLFGLEAQAVTGHDPANPFDLASLNQASRCNDREEGLAATRGHRSQDVGESCRFAARPCNDKACKSLLVRPQGRLRRCGHKGQSGANHYLAAWGVSKEV